MYQRGDIVSVPYPFTDLTQTKIRPALILSTDTYNAHRGDIIVAPITGNTSTGQPDDTSLTDWAEARLLKPSVVKGILGTVEQTLVVRILGTLSAADLQKVEQAFARALGLAISQLKLPAV